MQCNDDTELGVNGLIESTIIKPVPRLTPEPRAIRPSDRERTRAYNQIGPDHRLCVCLCVPLGPIELSVMIVL